MIVLVHPYNEETEGGRLFQYWYNCPMNNANPMFYGMSLCIKSTTDDFDTNLTLDSTYADFSGNSDMRENDVVDILNYLYARVAPDEKSLKDFPYLGLIDPYGHTFLYQNIVIEELGRMAKFANEHGDTDIILKIESITKYCRTVEHGHQILQFDGM